MAAVAERFSSDFPDSYPPEINYTPSVVDLKEELTRNARPTLMMLLVTAGIVLLIACANVANLTLARVIRRDRELAVRTALGAGRGRLLRQLVTESTLLAVIGGVVGLGVAFVGFDLLVGFVARFTPRAISVGIDGWVLAFTLLTSLATGLVFRCCADAWFSCGPTELDPREHPYNRLRQGQHSAWAHRRAGGAVVRVVDRRGSDLAKPGAPAAGRARI